MLSSKKIDLQRDLTAGVPVWCPGPEPHTTPWMYLFYSSLFLLHQSVLCAVCLLYISLSCPGCVCVSVLQQSVLSWMCLCVCSTAVCTVPGGVWPAFCSLCTCTARSCMTNRSLCCTWTVYLQELVLPFGVSVYTSFFTCTWGFLSTRACAPLTVCMSVYKIYKSFLLHLDWTSLSTRACAASERVFLHELLVWTWGACLQEPVLHLCVSVYKSFVLHLDVLNIEKPILNTVPSYGVETNGM